MFVKRGVLLTACCQWSQKFFGLGRVWVDKPAATGPFFVPREPDSTPARRPTDPMPQFSCVPSPVRKLLFYSRKQNKHRGGADLKTILIIFFSCFECLNRVKSRSRSAARQGASIEARVF